MQTFSLQQYEALRRGAGVLDRSSRGRIAASGADHLSYLHAMLTNDIAALVPGRGCYAAYLTPQGRMIADMRVFELGDLALLEVPGAVKADVLARLEQFVFSEDVQFVDLSDVLADLAVFGPRAAGVLSAALADPDTAPASALASLQEHASLRAGFEGKSIVVVANGELGVPGFDLFVDRGVAAQLLARLLESGAVPVEDAASEVLRTEAGRPAFGVDMFSDTIPLEAGIEQRAISFTKGCYPGQEIITRVLHRGHGRVARKLVGVTVVGDTVPNAGDAFEVNAENVGSVTSAVQSPALGSPIALGYIRRESAVPGTEITIVHAGERVPARVVELPFVAS